MKRTVGLGLGTLGFAVLWQQSRKLGRFKWPARGVAVVAYAGVGLALALGAFAATSNSYYVSVNSTGGTCNDSYTEAQARSSVSHPFCTLDAAEDVATAGSVIWVRGGTYPDWKIQTTPATKTLIKPYRTENVSTSGVWFETASNWQLSGIEVTGTDGTATPGTDTGRVLVDDSDDVTLKDLDVHDAIQGVRVINGSINTAVVSSDFEDLSCSLYLDSCGTNDEGSGVSADASLTGATVRSSSFTDLEGEAVEQSLGITETENRADALTRNTDRTGSWTVANLGASSFNTAYSSVTNGTTKVFRVPPGSYTGLPDPLISATAKTAGTRVVFLATVEHGVNIPLLFPRDGGSYTTWEDFKTSVFYIRRSTGVTMRDISVSFNSARDKNIFYVKGATDAKIIGGDTGPNNIWNDNPGGTDDGAAPQIDAYSGTALTNLTIEGHRFHDWFDEGGNDGHGECIHWFSGSGTIRGNTFDGCWVYDILLVDAQDLTIENNVFYATSPGASGSVPMIGTVSNVLTNVTMRNNTWLGGSSVNVTGPALTNVLVYDNAMTVLNASNSLCSKSGLTLTNNQVADVQSGTCDPGEAAEVGDLEASADGVPDRGGLLIDAATGSSPALDREGFARPFGSASDVGAFEYPVR